MRIFFLGTLSGEDKLDFGSLTNASERGKGRLPFLAFANFSGGGELKLTSLGEDKEMKHNRGMEDG